MYKGQGKRGGGVDMNVHSLEKSALDIFLKFWQGECHGFRDPEHCG